MSPPAPAPPAPPPGRARLFSRAGGIAAAYAAVASLWILFSDELLGLLTTEPGQLMRWSVYKGLIFVAVTTGLLLLLMVRTFGALESGFTRLAAQQAEIQRLHRLNAALSHINQAIVRVPGREELFRRACEVLVEHGGFRLAWIGWENPATHQLEPAAAWGEGQDYIKTIAVYADDRPEGRGPSGRAFRGNQPEICQDLLADPGMQPWRDEAQRHGLRSSAALPIRHGERVGGVLNVYAGEPGFFQDKELVLLTEVAADLALALDHLARDGERRLAEGMARTEMYFSETIIESMPGILYLYDQAGKFLRWNRNFQRVSGYSAEEISRMRPAEFFPAADGARLRERIAEVFAQGESSLEAEFRTKDGRLLPYFFTGRRVVFRDQVCLVGVGIDLTERRQAENALRESEERFHAFMDASPAIAWMTDEHGRHLYMNRAWDAAFGLNHADWLGRTADDLVPPEIAARIRESDAQVLAHDVALEIPEERSVLQGRPVFWNCVKFPFRNPAGRRFVGGFAIDITERKRAEAELQEVQGRLQIVVEHLTEGLIIADPAGDFLHWNPAALRLLGFADLEEGRRHQREFSRLFELSTLDGAPLPADRWPLARVRRGEPLDGLEIRVRRTGTDWERLFSYTGSLISYSGGRTLAFMTLRDITERKRAEAALRELNASLEHKVAARTGELQAALVRAEAADRIKSAFLATMSHELRTPLNSIIGFTGIILQGLAGPLNAEQTRQLGMVRGSARHLLELINDVLDISKIEAGQLEVRAEPFDLPESLARVTGSVRPLAEKKGLELVAEFAPGLGQMTGDRRRVEQILLNLLNNAIKFTERGRVTLHAGPCPDHRPAPDAAPVAAVCLRVTDTGIGIRPEHLSSLFLPFRQIDTGLSRQHEGTGLGLAICRRLAHLMGGEITAASEWSHGSEFTVILPCRKSPAS